MKTMALADGDLILGPSSDYLMVTGAKKVAQDVRGALLEPLGNDRFHPGWGSTLRDFVGITLDEYGKQQVLSEVNRVTGDYAAVQRDKVQAEEISGETTQFTTEEILAAVTYVDMVQNFDTLNFVIHIATVAGTSFALSEAIS